MIRPYLAADAPKLTAVHNLVYPQKPYTPAGFHQVVQGTLNAGGYAWTLVEDGVIGFAAVSHVVGLPQIGELSGFIAPNKQRRGYGTMMLQHLIRSLSISHIRQISYHLNDMNSAAAAFFLSNQFFREHEEVVLRLDIPGEIAQINSGSELAIKSYHREKTIALFCQLFDLTFADLPWDQPYNSEEVNHSLDRANDILFLVYKNQPVGFAWIHGEKDGLGVIEPLGILPEFQGRGFGRYLLQMTLAELVQEGIHRAQIGAWVDNAAAIHLYESVGFRRCQTIIYLAYNLP